MEAHSTTMASLPFCSVKATVEIWKLCKAEKYQNIYYIW